MAFANLPEFTARQILTAALLNQIITALQGFSTQTADISWPLTAGGNIDMDSQYTIVNMQTLWNITNADEYASLDAAVTAVEATSGGCLFIPPHTTIDGSTGITIDSSNFWIVGCGPTSIIDLSSGTGPLIDTAASLSNVGLMNLQLKNSGATASADAVVFRRTTGARLINVLFTSFLGDSVYFTNDGTAGNSCADAVLQGVEFAGGGTNGIHLRADDLDGCFMDNILSKSALATAISLVPVAASNGIIRDIQMGPNVRVESPAGIGVNILGGAAAADDKWSRISLNGVKVVEPTGDGFNIGEDNLILRNVSMIGCTVDTPGVDAFVVNAQRGQVSNCWSLGSTTKTGLDLVDSVDVSVTNNDLRNFITGIDCSSLPAASSCRVKDNDVRDYVTTAIARPAASVAADTVFSSNTGDFGMSTGNAKIRQDGTGATAETTTTLETYTIPAHTLRKEGDGLHIRAFWRNASGDRAGEMLVHVDAILASTLTLPLGLLGFSDVLVIVNNVGVTGASNTSYSYVSETNGANNAQMGNAAITVDWRADVDITFKVTIAGGTANDAISLQTFLIEGIGGDFGAV